MKVVKGDFNKGNAEVQEQLTETLKDALGSDKSDIEGFAVVFVHGGDKVSYSYSSGDYFHALVGALRCLELELLSGVIAEAQGTE